MRAILLCGAIILATAFTPVAAQQMALAPGDPAPPLIGWDLDGRLLTVEWQGITLVNFWATWCAPCREEMPILQELHDAYQGDGFRVIGMVKDLDASIEGMTKFLEEVPVEYSILKPDRKAEWTDVAVVPTSFLIDEKGKVLRRYVGATSLQVEGLKKDVDDVMNGRPLGPMYIPPPDPDSP